MYDRFWAIRFAKGATPLQLSPSVERCAIPSLEANEKDRTPENGDSLQSTTLGSVEGRVLSGEALYHLNNVCNLVVAKRTPAW